MICEDNFNSLTKRAKNYKYFSMNYIEYDACKNARIIHNNENLIFMLVDFFNTDLPGTMASLQNIGTIEYLKPDEFEEVARLSQKCRLQSRGFEGETPQWYSEWLNENSIIIKRKGSKIVGFCCVSVYNKGTTLWIRELAVDPAYQRMGYGKELVEHAITYGVKDGATKGFLLADVLNKNAIGLYNKYNFYATNDDYELQLLRKG